MGRIGASETKNGTCSYATSFLTFSDTLRTPGSMNGACRGVSAGGSSGSDWRGVSARPSTPARTADEAARATSQSNEASAAVPLAAARRGGAQRRGARCLVAAARPSGGSVGSAEDVTGMRARAAAASNAHTIIGRSKTAVAMAIGASERRAKCRSPL